MHHADGSENAPEEIIKQLNELYSSESETESNFEIIDIKTDNFNIEETNKNVFDEIKKQKGQFIVLGGDHSITYSSFKAFEEENKDAGIIIFDAHPDCINNFNPPTQEDYLKTLIEEKKVKSEKVILIGLRNWHSSEISYLKQKKIKYFTMKEVFEKGIKEIIEGTMEVSINWPATYLSIDIDVVDPAFAPGTGWTEPGGITSRELIYSVQKLRLLENLKAIDIVEVLPDKDINNMTSKLAAKLIKELN